MKKDVDAGCDQPIIESSVTATTLGETNRATDTTLPGQGRCIMATIPKKAKKSSAPLVLPEKATGKAAAKVTEVKASKFKGLKTGMRVMEFQDSTFAANGKAMLTDEELAAVWRAEFPQAVAFTPNHVKGARRDYNAGKHSSQYRDKKPATPLAEVVMDGNKRRFVTDAKTEVAEPKKAPKKVKAAA